MLLVTAFEIGDPVAVNIKVEGNYFPLDHERRLWTV
jgi:hypothetical protein